MELTKFLPDEQATVAFGAELAKQLQLLRQQQTLSKGISVHLNGELGAGKTTLSRGIVTGLGHIGRVKSPTYTLVEPYELSELTVYHFDLYRLADPEELEFMGIRDYFSVDAVCLIEWPQKAGGWLPAADLSINLVYVEQQRNIELRALSALGEQLVKALM